MSGCIGYCQDVIDPMLQDVINEKDKEMIEINIIFKSQIDVEKLNERGANINDKRLRRSILIDELKFFSEEKQQDVMSILLAEEKNSNVSKIRSHWLSNAISCNASRDVIYLLAKHPDIEMIGIDGVTQCTGLTIENEHLIADSELTYNVSMVNADKVWDLGYTGQDDVWLCSFWLLAILVFCLFKLLGGWLVRKQ